VEAKDVGLWFLEETFDAASAPPGWQRHRAAARAVLATLLPEPGADPGDRGRPRHELLTASGYPARPADFEALMRTLVGEVGLITPVEAGDRDHGAEASMRETREGHYRLTHDCLVAPLRVWLSHKAADDRKSRDGLSMSDRTVPRSDASEP